MATSFFQIDNFPNLENPKYLDGGLFNNLKTNQYIKDCTEAFKDKFPEQTSFFILKDSLKQILKPTIFFDKVINEDEKDLYAFAFCYCLDESGKFLLPYLRLRLVYAKPEKYNEKDVLSHKIKATVYANPIGIINKRLSSNDNFEWLIDPVKILQTDQDTNNWADIHSVKFPLSPPLNTMHGQNKKRIYEGNIISRKRLNYIYEEEIEKNNKKGIMLNFAYDKEFNKIFLVFSIESVEFSNFVTLSNMDEPLKCPPEELDVCKSPNKQLTN